VFFNTDPNRSWEKTLTGDIPTYVIYYGSGITDVQKSLFDIFAGNIKNHPVWSNVVKNNYGGGSPYFQARVNIGCSWSCGGAWNNCYPCTVNQWQEAGLLNTLFKAGTVAKNANALYVFVYGTDINYVFSNGNGQMCATHDIAETDVGGGHKYRYISLPIIKSETAACNFLRNTGYPNNDYRVDSGVAMLFHEMVEGVLPNWIDSSWYAIADKCGNQAIGVGTAGTKANVLVGGQKYLLPSIWDKNSQTCTLSLSTTSTPQNVLLKSHIKNNFCLDSPASNWGTHLQ
jgi:hypothetical protein